MEFECAAAALPPKSSAFLQVMRWVNGEFQVFHRSEAVYDSDEPKFGSESHRRADRVPVVRLLTVASAAEQSSRCRCRVRA